jgi:hypothetical protein
VSLLDVNGFYRAQTIPTNVYFFVVDHEVKKWERNDGDYKDVKICKPD